MFDLYFRQGVILKFVLYTHMETHVYTHLLNSCQYIFPICFQVIPSAILAILIHPYTQHSTISKMMWAFCVYLESVSVLPQLRLIQNAKVNVVSQSSLLPAHSLSMSLTSNKNSFLLGQMPFFFWQMVEPFTAHYVFALGVARFLGCAHWILQVSRYISCLTGFYVHVIWRIPILFIINITNCVENLNYMS